MSITPFQTAPDNKLWLNTVSLVNNSATVGISSDSYEETAAVPGVIVLKYNSGYDVDDKVTLSWKGTEMDLTVKLSPNDEGYELPVTFSLLKEAFEKNLIIYNYYDVVADAGAKTITLTQKVASTEDELLFVSIDTPSGNLTKTSETAAVDFAYKPNYKFIMETRKLDDDSLMGVVQQVIDGDPQAVDYASTFEDYFNRTLYDFAETEPFVAEGIFIQYFLRMYEEWGLNALPYNMIQKYEGPESSPGVLLYGVKPIVIDGGVDFHDFIDFDDKDYWYFPNGAIKWLTSQYQNRLVYTDQLVYLHIILSSAVDYRLSVTLYYQDGTNSSYTLSSFSGPGSGLLKLYAIPTSYEALDIASNTTVDKTVDKYSVQMQYDNSSVWESYSQEFSFCLEYRSRQYKTHFFFAGSYGGNETAVLHGKKRTITEQSSEEFYGVKAWNQVNGNFGNSNQSQRTGYVFHSGLITKEEKNYLKDLTGSKFVYFKDDDDKWKKLVMSKTIKDAIEEDDGFYTFEFEAKLANYD